MAVQGTFYDVITQAVTDIAAHGYDSQSRIGMWVDRIRTAAQRSLVPPPVLEEALRDTMRSIYGRMVERGDIFKMHPGVARYMVERIKPKLRIELDRRIMTSAQLIKLNRETAINKTVQRFSGWASSVPAGGSKVVDKVETKDDIRKALADLPYEERRVAVDQGHKFVAALNDIVATDGGAIAGIWHQHYTRDPRKGHTEREGKIYLIRHSWAHDAGLVRAGAAGYTDEIEQPAEFVYCRCTYQYVYALRDLPTDMLTARGKEELLRVREKMRRSL